MWIRSPGHLEALWPWRVVACRDVLVLAGFANDIFRLPTPETDKEVGGR